MDHARVLEAVIRWAEGDENIRAVVLEGSLARDDPTVDAWSDLDVRLYVSDTEPLLSSRQWFEQFGDVLVVEALENPGWFPTRLVYYVDAKIDFLIAPATTLSERRRFGRAVRVLVDKDALTTSIAQGDRPDVVLPDSDTFLAVVHEFYAAALMYARMYVRDEPLKAKYRDWDMKTRLVRMIAWDHEARYGSERAVDPSGARFRSWADPEIVDELDASWSGGLDVSHTGLFATTALFTRTSDRVAVAVGLPPFDSEPVIREIERITSTAAD